MCWEHQRLFGFAAAAAAAVAAAVADHLAAAVAAAGPAAARLAAAAAAVGHPVAGPAAVCQCHQQADTAKKTRPGVHSCIPQDSWLRLSMESLHRPKPWGSWVGAVMIERRAGEPQVRLNAEGAQVIEPHNKV